MMKRFLVASTLAVAFFLVAGTTMLFLAQKSAVPSAQAAASNGVVTGQSLTVSLAAGSTTPSVLIHYANVVSVTATSLTISVFGQSYTVDASQAQIVNQGWSPTTLSAYGAYANVWGNLDAQNNMLIHATRVRDPNPETGGGTGTGTGTSTGTTTGT